MRAFPTLSCMSLVCTLALSACSSDDTAGVGGSGGGPGGAAGSGGTAGTPQAGPISGPVTRYDYVIDSDALTANTTLTVDVQAPGGDCVDFESVVSPSGPVMWNGADAVSATTDMGVMRVCGAPVFPGVLNVQVPTPIQKKKYFGLDVGFSKRTSMDGGQFSYMLSWVGGCDNFGPCDDDPSKLSEFRFEIKHAMGTPVLCPGVLTAGDTTTTCEVAGTLAPTYSAVAWASDPTWKRSPFMNAAGVDWVFYEAPSGKLRTSLSVTAMTQFFEWLTGLFGDFPYGNELRFAGGPTAWLGFEHPANIILYESLAGLPTDYTDALTHVTMHEVVHQWAGDRTTLADAADFVWKEAMAEYVPYVFEDEVLGPEVAAATRAYWDGVALQSGHYPRPTDKPTPPVNTFYGDVYGPGPMVLFVQLEGLIGRDSVMAGIQAFLKPAAGRSVAELQAALEEASGQDLKAYFDAWVFGSGAPEWPTMKVDTVQNGNEVTVTVTQQNASAKVYPCVVEVDVSGATQTVTASVNFGLAPSGASANTKVTLAEPIVGASLDPRNKLIAKSPVSPAVKPKPRPVWIF
ncbi:MAG: hypothetical protein IPK82_17300 [Polyangiaceae bacterium]|nr:hypothetical protein [Polyangiaceae bacterium]